MGALADFADYVKTSFSPSSSASQGASDSGGVCTAPPDGTVTIPEVTVVGDPSGGMCQDPNASQDPPAPPAPNTCEPQDLESKATQPEAPEDSGAADAAKEVAKSGFWHVVGHKISHTFGGIISIAIETLQLECDSPHKPTKWRFTCSCGAEGENRNSPEEAQLDADSHVRENHADCDPGQLDGPSCPTPEIKDNRCDFSEVGSETSDASGN